MDWARILAYITGTVDQELLLRNEYLVLGEFQFMQRPESEKVHCSVISRKSCLDLRIEVENYR